jgi:hypothetical protein
MVRKVFSFRFGVFARRIINRPELDGIPVPRRLPLALLMRSCRIWYAQSILAQIITILFAGRKQGKGCHGHPLEQPSTLLKCESVSNISLYGFTLAQPVTLKLQLAERKIQQSKIRGCV